MLFCLPNDIARKLTTDVDKALCTKWVNGSTTWEGAMTNAIKALVEVAKAAKPTALDLIDQQMTLFLTPSWQRNPLVGNCTQAFDGFVYDMGRCLEWVNNDPSKDLSTTFQVDHFQTCRKLVPEGYPVAEIDQFDVNKSFYSIPLAIISSKSGGHGCCETAINDESHNSSRFCLNTIKGS
ncbi:hypothetical protein CASFOL_004195 [Castilleja foliolosa]|uniref:Uncharacterized protein n=1 Tax=Castilleja foliolosa TaxID=1961234 RepID=A0ABD3E9P5_9LAMI